MSDELDEYAPDGSNHPDDATDMGEPSGNTLHDKIQEILNPEELQHLTASDKSLRIANATLHIMMVMNAKVDILEEKIRLLAENNNVLTDRVRRFEFQNARQEGESGEDADVSPPPDPGKK